MAANHELTPATKQTGLPGNPGILAINAPPLTCPAKPAIGRFDDIVTGGGGILPVPRGASPLLKSKPRFGVAHYGIIWLPLRFQTRSECIP